MLQSLDDQIVFAPRWPASPFPGLRPFRITATEDESLIFYGRNRAKDEILARLNSSHLVVVVGPSGCGKSSLLKVGVIPALEAGLLTHVGPNWRTIDMRPGDRPVRNLACALAALRTDASKSDISDQLYDILCSDESGLWLAAETLAPRAAPNPLLILIDQFEEVFGSQISAQSESKLLLELIVAFWAKAHPNLFLVVTMRTDFLEQCANFPKLADAINATLFMTPVLRDSELKTVISLPPEPYHGMVEPKLVEATVKDTPSEIGYNPDHLPLMQHALSWLWNNAISAAGLSNSPPRPDAAAPSQTIVLAHDRYLAHGGLKGILNEHADELLAGLSEREQRIAQVVFTRLSERDENRYRRSPTSATALVRLADCETAELERVVSVFSDPSVCFLDRRPLANGAGELIDVSHESLIRQWDRLRGWVDEEAEKVQKFEELAAAAKQWQRHKRSPSFLKRGAELGVWRQWWRSQRPTREWAERYKVDRAGEPAALEPVGLSNEYLRKSRKRVVRKWVLIGTLTAAVAIVIGSISVLIPITNIKTEKATLETEKYETAAARGYDLIKSEDPNLALLLALALLHPKEPDGDAIEALAYKALEFLGLKEFLHLKEVDDSAIERLPYKALEFLGLKKLLHLKEVDDSAIERLAYKALQTPRPKAVLSAPAALPTATFSPDGQLLLISKGNAFQVWKANELELVVRELRPQGVSAGRRAVWSADGRWIIGATDDKRTALFAPCSVPLPALRKYFQQCVNKNEDEVWTIGEKGTVSWPSTLSPTGDRLLTGGSGQAPQLWDIGSKPAKPTFRFPDGRAIAFNQQGDRLALGRTDGSIRIHETANPAEGFTLRPQTRCDASGENPSAEVFSVAFNPGKDKGDEMVSTTLDGCLRLWNVKERRLIADHNLNNTGFFSASFDPSGRRIAMTSDDGSVRIWEPGNPDKPELILRGHRSATWTVEFSRETGLLASASSESVRIWTLTPALHPSTLPAAPDLFGAVGPPELQAGALTLHIGEQRDVTLDDPRPGQNVVAAAVSKDGDRILVAEKEKTLKLYDLSASQAPLAKFEVPGVEWKAVGFLSEPDRMVGETTKGEFFAWPFFKDRDALIEFAKKSLPVDQNLETIELSQVDKCRFGVDTKSPPCPEN
jgi:WD40 repeat protein/energy-coupling factor transporter ATP-binding protein EcfA2